MSLSSHHLEAFHAVAQTLHFSRAARRLHITQPALSQRIQLLEEELRTAVFLRAKSGVKLTEAGERLLRYCQIREALEQEVMTDLKTSRGGRTGELKGILRIGGFSSVMRSVALPALAPLMRQNVGIVLHLLMREVADLPALLKSGEIDYMLLDRSLGRSDIEEMPLGTEFNVLAEAVRGQSPVDVFLDHDPEDLTTERFWQQQQPRPKKYERRYLDDIYGIIDAIALCLGRGVVPRHMIAQDPRIREVKGLKPLAIPVVLHFPKQPYYSRLHEAVLRAMAQHRGLLS